MGTVVMYSSVSVDGFVADEHDQPGPLFDWLSSGEPPGGIDHMVVVTHRPKPEGWHPEAPFHFVDGVEAAVAKAQELAGDRMVVVSAAEAGGQVLTAGLVDEVRMDVVPVVLGSGKRYFGSVDAQHLLEDTVERRSNDGAGWRRVGLGSRRSASRTARAARSSPAGGACHAASHSSDETIACSVMGFLVTPQRGR
ncbi:dihydrofolate reductase [Amycolatopsis cihanbeyliensis]|uniref:Dihydrofolate reductase n=1 Tax=Amycolatopsis cihanbeyliensis TaxID=1128664 RepID=A0A542DF77_AMYCI|nr:dihydrofolate reductase [Amycolatopsis cihanbeyliensis]